LCGVPGRGSIKHCPVLMGLVDWRKPIRGVVWVWVFAGAGLVFAGVRLVMGAARVAKPGQRDPSTVRGLGRAGLRRLSRRGSWVQIPPPAP